MSDFIPIQNIYYLLCYAWNRLDEGGTVDVSAADLTSLPDLFAYVLINGVNHLLKRGLEQGYVALENDLQSIRGRVLVAKSARRMLLQHGRAFCEYDELTVNTRANKILKSTLMLLTKTSGLDSSLSIKSSSLCRDLPEIDVIPVSRQSFRKIQLSSNSRYYRFLLDICKLIVENILVDEQEGMYHFRDFRRDDRQMARMFERFIFNYIKKERSILDVRKEKISWDASSEDFSDIAFLPTMETDISVRSTEKTLIIDAKYYRKTLSTYFESESIHSANLYQLFSYLKNLEARGGPDASAKGILLYPYAGQNIDFNYNMQGHPLSIKTLDLSVDWKKIGPQIDKIIDEYFAF